MTCKECKNAKGEEIMKEVKAFFNFIKDCIRYSKVCPFTTGSRVLYIRNLIYLNSQPKYFYGRCIDFILNR